MENNDAKQKQLKRYQKAITRSQSAISRDKDLLRLYKKQCIQHKKHLLMLLGQYIIDKYPIKTMERNKSDTDWKRDKNGNVKYYNKKVYTPKDFNKYYTVAHKMTNDNKHANVKTDK